MLMRTASSREVHARTMSGHEFAQHLERPEGILITQVGVSEGAIGGLGEWSFDHSSASCPKIVRIVARWPRSSRCEGPLDSMELRHLCHTVISSNVKKVSSDIRAEFAQIGCQ